MRHMKLIDYITRERLTFAEFGRRAGTRHARTIERIAKGQRDPGPKLIRGIIDASNGEVTANDLYPVAQAN